MGVLTSASGDRFQAEEKQNWPVRVGILWWGDSKAFATS